MSDPIVIIGSGLGGYVLAKEFRRADQQTPLMIITKDAGEFYHKPLLSAAMERSISSLSSSSAAEMEESLPATIKTHTEVLALDREQRSLRIGDQVVRYKACVLACGAIPIALPVPGADHERVMSVNNLHDYRVFRDRIDQARRVVVIGGGLVGSEFATNLAQSGRMVSVVSLGDPVEGLLPPDLSANLRQVLEGAGINWYGNDPVVAIEEAGAEVVVVLASGLRLVADMVLSAIGLRSNVGLARSAGLEINQGIVTDCYGRTQDSNIYCLGDCAEVAGHVLRYVAPLRHMAVALGKTLAGQPTPVTYPAMPVLLKMPPCPTVVAPPPADCEGEWQIIGDRPNLDASFIDDLGQLRGFALMGNAVARRAERARALPPLLVET